MVNTLSGTLERCEAVSVMHGFIYPPIILLIFYSKECLQKVKLQEVKYLNLRIRTQTEGSRTIETKTMKYFKLETSSCHGLSTCCMNATFVSQVWQKNVMLNILRQTSLTNYIVVSWWSYTGSFKFHFA